MTITKITEYNNGNTKVQIFSDGTKIREYKGTPVVDFPESIDVKITDYCDLGCKYCHESSTTKGVHADLVELLCVLPVVSQTKQRKNSFPRGIELAIGGGNPLSHPKIENFLLYLKDAGYIANLTINQGHLQEYQELIQKLIKNELVRGLGISITSRNYDFVCPLLEMTDNIVYHVIAGVNKPSVIDELMKLGKAKILVLGYKKFGFGIEFHKDKIDKVIKEWYTAISSYLGKCVLSFDNLAIEQLNIKRLFTDEGWNNFYMGDDFVHSMYIDAVKQEYAPTSRSNKRVSFKSKSLLEFFRDKQ